jgi:hypothetical protein
MEAAIITTTIIKISLLSILLRANKLRQDHLAVEQHNDDELLLIRKKGALFHMSYITL